MPQTCTICTQKKRAHIEAALAAGASLRNVAKQYNVSPASLFRHKNGCMKPALQVVQQQQQQEQEQATGLNLYERLLRDANLIDQALKEVWDEKGNKDVDKLLKVLNASLQQHRFYAEWQRDKSVDELAARLVEMEQQLEALLTRKSA